MLSMQRKSREWLLCLPTVTKGPGRGKSGNRGRAACIPAGHCKGSLVRTQAEARKGQYYGPLRGGARDGSGWSQC